MPCTCRYSWPPEEDKAINHLVLKFKCKNDCVLRADGFTLIELMVVVAIIGILSSVAVPNFRKYQAKVKQSEAKLQLAAVYTAETAFYETYGTYGSCLELMGVDVLPKGYYLVGFREGFDASSKFEKCTATEVYFFTPSTEHLKMGPTQVTESDLPAKSRAYPAAFVAGAVGSVSTTNGLFDKWIINDIKKLENVSPGF